MTISPKQLEQIAAAAEGEVNRWSDDRFGGVDIPGHQAGRDFLARSVGGDETTDPRFSPLDDRGSAYSIKTAVEQLARDPEIREQIARETGNADELEKLDEEQAEAAVWEFRRRNPGYHKSEANWERMVQRMCAKFLGWPDADEIEVDDGYAELVRRGLWTVDNLTTAFKALWQAGSLEVSPDAPRLLTERDKRAIALQSASGDVEGGVARYLQLRLPRQVSEMWVYSTSLQEALDGVADPQYKDIVSEAVWFTWEAGRANYSPTPERRKFMQAYVAGRIPTARMLDEAWRVCQESERDVARTGVLGQLNEQRGYTPENTSTSLDTLDDASVDRLYHQTLREYARSARPAGILA